MFAQGRSPGELLKVARDIDAQDSKARGEIRRTSSGREYLLRRPKITVDPRGKFRQRWDVASVVFITYSSLMLPFDAAFNFTEPLGLLIVHWMIDFFFGLDIFLNFITGVDESEEDGGKYVQYEYGAIAKRYVKTWFLLDFISAFPFELITENNSDAVPQALKIFKLTRLLRLVRLGRIGRVLRIIRRLENSVFLQEGARDLMIYFSGFLFLAHWFSCAFFGIGDADRGYVHNGANQTSWANGINLQGSDIDTNYLAAFYSLVATLTTVGYGDVSSQNNGQRILGIFSMIAGALIFSYGVSHIVNVVDEMRGDSTKFKQELDKWNRYMVLRCLPTELRGDIREYLMAVRKAQIRTVRDEQDLVAQLSYSLRSQIALAINEHYLYEMPFFLGAEPELTMELALSMASIYFSSHEDVVREGEEGDAMYFIVTGQAEVTVGRPVRTRVAVLVEKQYFGETALLKPEGQRIRSASVTCLVFSELRLLKATDFTRILKQFPATRRQIEQVSDTRMRSLAKRKKREEEKSGGSLDSSSLTTPTSASESNPKTTRRFSSKKLQDALKDDAFEAGAGTLINAAVDHHTKDQLHESWNPDAKHEKAQFPEQTQPVALRNQTQREHVIKLLASQLSTLQTTIGQLSHKVHGFSAMKSSSSRARVQRSAKEEETKWESAAIPAPRPVLLPPLITTQDKDADKSNEQ